MLYSSLTGLAGFALQIFVNNTHSMDVFENFYILNPIHLVCWLTLLDSIGGNIWLQYRLAVVNILDVYVVWGKYLIYVTQDSDTL